MVIPFGIKMDEAHSLQFSRRTRDAIMRQTYMAVGMRWQQKWLPWHFVIRARDRYGYGKRSKKWLARKRREARTNPGKVKDGGYTDIVYTGLAKSLFQRLHAVRAYPSRATIKMHGPRYIGMRPIGKNRHAIGMEITKLIDEELRDLDEHAKAVMGELIKQAPPKRTIIRSRGQGGQFTR